jgi:HSP20 family protein
MTPVKNHRGISPWRFNIDNFLDDTWPDWPKTGNAFPAVNVLENDKNYTVEVVAPGFQKADFKLKVEDDILTISAENKSEKAEEGKEKEYTRREYSYNSFTRSFHLPDNVKDDAINASYQDGILKLELPKSENKVKATKEIAIS